MILSVPRELALDDKLLAEAEGLWQGFVACHRTHH
jgi:hypothetical protein